MEILLEHFLFPLLLFPPCGGRPPDQLPSPPRRNGLDGQNGWVNLSPFFFFFPRSLELDRTKWSIPLEPFFSFSLSYET